MKQKLILCMALVISSACMAQNVGIGTTTPLERLHVVGNKAFFETNFLGVGTNIPTNIFTGVTFKNNVNNYYGMYIDAGVTGQPFYGYALGGTPVAYTQFNGSSNQFEYYHSSGGSPDFQIAATSAAFPHTTFLGIGTTTPTTGFTGLALKNNVNTFFGTYVDAGATGIPFYGYALNGTAVAYTGFNGNTTQFEYHHTSDAVADFQIGATTAAFPTTSFLGIGTTTPTTGFTGLALKSAANAFWGMYVDAGSTGVPFYGYALNGTARSYTAFNATNNAYEYHQTSDAIADFSVNGNVKAVFNTAFVGIGTSTPTTPFTGFAMKTSANAFYGSYVDAGPTGIPFYGWALNGTARAYGAFNGTNNAYEYHQTSDAIADFSVNGNIKAVFNTAFVGIGTSTPTTPFTGFAMKTSANAFYGSYVDAGTTGVPFYGYALNGTAVAYTTFNGGTGQFEYHHTSDAIPDFAVNNTQVLFPIQTFLGLGTTTPTTGSATGFAMKKNTNSYYGMYIDAGATGEPFYGYALNGSGIAWTEINGSNQNNWELNYGGVRLAVTSSGNVGIGTSSPATKLDVSGTIRASNLIGGATSLSTDALGNIIRTPSDANLKTNLEEIEKPLEKVMAMHGVTYNFKNADRFGSGRQMGFLAQELEKVIPSAVSSGGEYKSVNYQVITALLTEAIKVQEKKIESQATENAELKKMVQNLAERVNTLEKNK